MDAFISRKRRRIAGPQEAPSISLVPKGNDLNVISPQADMDEDGDTDFKLALLASLHPHVEKETLLEVLLASQGSVQQASEILTRNKASSPRKMSGLGTEHQASLAAFGIAPVYNNRVRRIPPKKGKTLHLYHPQEIEKNTPCSLILNFLPRDEADALLLELMKESPTYTNLEFQLFDRVVKSPHTFCFYVVRNGYMY